MQSVGALVREQRDKREWSQRVLAEKTGFSREYVAGVEWSGKGSVNFLKACERVFELEAGSLVKWPCYSAARFWCRRNKIRMDDYLEMLRGAEAAFRPASANRGESPGSPSVDDPAGPGPVEEAANGPLKRRLKDRTRRIMSRVHEQVRLELLAFFNDCAVVLLGT